MDKTVFILLTEDTVALHKRSTSGLLAGMWEFPNVDAKLDKQAAVTQVTGWQAEPLDLLMQTSYTHIFSHVEWHMTAYYIRCRKQIKMEVGNKGESGRDVCITICVSPISGTDRELVGKIKN